MSTAAELGGAAGGLAQGGNQIIATLIAAQNLQRQREQDQANTQIRLRMLELQERQFEDQSAFRREQLAFERERFGFAKEQSINTAATDLIEGTEDNPGLFDIVGAAGPNIIAEGESDQDFDTRIQGKQQGFKTLAELFRSGDAERIASRSGVPREDISAVTARMLQQVSAEAREIDVLAKRRKIISPAQAEKSRSDLLAAIRGQRDPVQELISKTALLDEELDRQLLGLESNLPTEFVPGPGISVVAR